MKLLYISILIFFGVSDTCDFNFQPLGLDDYEINISFDELTNLTGNLTEIGKSKVDNQITIYSIKKNSKVLKKKSEVTYHFAFKNNLLKAYTFRIPIKNDYKFYKEFVKQAKEYNGFINSKRISFLQKDNCCEKFLRMKTEEKNIIIFGGINVLNHYW